jgi:hypothetical protein
MAVALQYGRTIVLVYLETGSEVEMKMHQDFLAG